MSQKEQLIRLRFGLYRAGPDRELVSPRGSTLTDQRPSKILSRLARLVSSSTVVHFGQLAGLRPTPMRCLDAGEAAQDDPGDV